MSLRRQMKSSRLSWIGSILWGGGGIRKHDRPTVDQLSKNPENLLLKASMATNEVHAHASANVLCATLILLFIVLVR